MLREIPFFFLGVLASWRPFFRGDWRSWPRAPPKVLACAPAAGGSPMSSAPKFENLVELFERSVKLYGSRPLFGTKKGDGFVWTTYEEVGEMVDACHGGLAALGIKHGDKVCVISNNRVEWAVLAYACYGLGAALVPMYEAQLPKEWAFI